MNVKKIKLAELIIGTGRVRKPDASYVEELARSMADLGQTTPIEARKIATGHELVAGAHRVEAAKLLGWTAIDAVVVECSERQARIREIEENLMRRELSILARAMCLTERKELYEVEFPETKRGGDRRSDQTATVAVRSAALAFSLNAGELLGVSERTIRDWIKLATQIEPKAADLLLQTTLADDRKELLWIGQNIERPDQLKVIEAALKDREKPSEYARSTRAVPAMVDAIDQQVTFIRSKWEKSDSETKRKFVEWLYDSGQLNRLLSRLGLADAA